MNMLINNNWVGSSDDTWFDVNNPASGTFIDRAPQGTLDDVKTAVKAAQLGKEEMRKMPAHKRSEVLMRIAALMEENQEELSTLLAQENGKPILQTRGELAASIRIFRGFAEEAKRIFSKTVPLDTVPGMESHFAVTIRQPLGVVAGLIPFNYPVELFAHKAASALAAGNSFITKPPPECPLTLFKIAELMQQSGLPKNAHQVITGPGEIIGDHLARTEGVQLISMTGSTTIGKLISKVASDTLKKVHLELGGNDPTIVCGDADLDRAAEAVILGRLARGNGQICCAVKRVLVDASVFDQFTKILTEKANALITGDQMDEATDLGPLISEQAAQRVEASIQEAVAAGAIIETGGKRKGTFIEPTVLTKIKTDMRVYAEETFGPVVPLVSFDTLDEAVELANDCPYGLQAAVFTKDLSVAMDVAHRLEVGGVIINWSSAVRAENLPFGGVKLSGNAREGIHDTLKEMTEQKSIVMFDVVSTFSQD